MVSKFTACALLTAAACAISVDRGLSLQLSLESSSSVSLDLALNVDRSLDEDCHEWQGQCGVYPDCQPCEPDVAALDADCALQNLCGEHPNCVECEVEAALDADCALQNLCGEHPNCVECEVEAALDADCALQNLCGEHPNCVECEVYDQCPLTLEMLVEELAKASDSLQDEKIAFDEVTRALFDSSEFPFESWLYGAGHIEKYGPVWSNCFNRDGWSVYWNPPEDQGFTDTVFDFENFQLSVRNKYCQDVRDGVWPIPVYDMIQWTSVEPEPQSCAETQEAFDLQSKIFRAYDRQLDLFVCNKYMREHDWNAANP